MNTLPENLDVWVLAGQSNMQGCGLLEGALSSDERVWNFSSVGKWEIAREPLHRLWESYTPVHQNFMRGNLAEADRAKTNEEFAAFENETRKAGAGLGISFGKAMSDATGKPIGLISAAHGGTSLEDWNPNRKNQGGDSLYGGMLSRIQKAGGNLRGILWYQGESDSFAAQSESYAARFQAWVEAVRADLSRPDLPVIATQLGRVLQGAHAEGWDKNAWQTVREAQRLLPAQVPHTAISSAVDLGLCDSIHIDTPGLIRLGKRMARLALSFQSGSTPDAPSLLKIEAGRPSPHGFGVARVVCAGVDGKWNPQNNISGFQICAPDGEVHPEAFVISANAEEKEPNVINVIVNTPLDDSIRIGYGLGLNPLCNAVDDSDAPLPAFSPQAVSQSA